MFLVSLDLQEGMDCQDQEDCQVYQVHKEILVKMASKEKLVHLDQRGSKEQRVKLVLLEALVLEAKEENLVQ